LKRAFVTGANGFIGSHLCRHLLTAGYRVRALVRRTSDLTALSGVGIDLVCGDVTAPAGLAPILAEADLVFHLAGITRGRNQAEYDRVNVTGTRNLIEAALGAGTIERFVFVSSQAAAGPARRDAPLTEAVPPAPIGPYGRSKLAAERICLATITGQTELTIVRPVIVYGPRDDDLLALYRLVRRGLVPTVPGDILASMIHVDDLVDLLERAGRLPVAAGRTYFAADPEPYRLRQVAGLIGRALGNRVRFFPLIPHLLYPLALLNEPFRRLGAGSRALALTRLKDFLHRFWTVDPAAAMTDLEWTPSTVIEEGIAATTAWYREHNWL
jgi:nucleoside-diphosphate-sugar epimerase